MQFGDFLIEEELGSGGFGKVYRATAERFSGPVAIKLLKVQKDTARRRLAREIQLLSSLKHKNIIPILAYELEANPIWFAMPLADDSLHSRLTAGPLERPQIHDYFLQILDGVGYAHTHANRIIHRDLKPENILVFGNELLISDFGISKPLERGEQFSTITQYRVGIGSPGYVAPEQWEDVRKATIQSDIYSLGMVLYTLVANSIPNPTHDMSKVPRQYEYVIQRCARQRPQTRFVSVAELKEQFLNSIDRSAFQISSADEEQLSHLFARDSTPELANDVLRVFYNNGDNRRLYKACFPKLPQDYLRYFSQDSLLDDFTHILAQYDEYVDGQLNFQYCDVVADFYQNIASVCNDINVFRLILQRLLRIGVMHNRWHVMDVFCDVICSLTEKDVGKTMTAVEIIQQQSEDFQILHVNKSSRLSECSLPRLLRQAIGTVTAAIPNS